MRARFCVRVFACENSLNRSILTLLNAKHILVEFAIARENRICRRRILKKPLVIWWKRKEEHLTISHQNSDDLWPNAMFEFIVFRRPKRCVRPFCTLRATDWPPFSFWFSAKNKLYNFSLSLIRMCSFRRQNTEFVYIFLLTFFN